MDMETATSLKNYDKPKTWTAKGGKPPMTFCLEVHFATTTTTTNTTKDSFPEKSN